MISVQQRCKIEFKSLFCFGVCLSMSFLISSSSFSMEYEEQVEKVIPLRSNGKLQILNNRGDIIIEGWSQDKIRLSLKKKAVAENVDDAQKLLKSVEIVHQVIEGNVEISAKFGHGLSLQERFKERADPKTSMQMTLLAPAGRGLQVLALHGNVVLKTWRGSVEIRSASGRVEVENVKGSEVFILCPSCIIEAKDVHADLRCVGADKGIQLENVEGNQVYVESDSGGINAQKIKGEQLYVSKTGPILVHDTKGIVEFLSREAQVQLTRVSGFISGKTTTGNILLKIAEWVFLDKALVESVTGNIAVALPEEFVGELDLHAEQGKLHLGIPMEAGEIKNKTQAPGKQNSSKHLTVSIHGGDDQLRVVSEKGDIGVTYWK